MAITAGLTAAVAPLALAQGTHLWTQSRLEEFEKGTPEGVALWSDGSLRAGPDVAGVATTASAYVWSVAVDKDGTAYLGTGSPATVLRVSPDGKVFPLFKTRDVAVEVVRLGPNGALYAATIPSGKVYRLDPHARVTENDTGVSAKGAELVFDAAQPEGTKAGDTDGKASSPAENGGPAAGKGAEKQVAGAHYIWAMTFDKSGQLYLATGGPAAVYRFDPAKQGARPELFFKSDDAHIRSLAWDKDGNLIAGSDGSGLVYRISPEGKGYVLFEAPRREITSLAVASDGTIYAAAVGEKGQNPLPPLSPQATASITITVVQPGSLNAANTSASLPGGSEIYALTPGQAPRKLWAGKNEIVYALHDRPGGLLALTGNRGRVFEIRGDGSYADIVHLDAQQGLSLAVAPGTGADGDLYIGTGNTGKLCRLAASGKTHVYASDVLDTGSFARFGRVEVQPGSEHYQILTRTGNVEQPVRGWSPWKPLRDGVVASPPGRFLQWKAVLEPGGMVGSVGVNYLPVNAAPVVDAVVVVPGARLNPQSSPSQPQTVSIAFPASGQDAGISADANSSNSPLDAVKDRTAITVRWAAHDDNGDHLVYSLYLRGDGETVWRLLKKGITAKACSFSADLIPDGGYRIKVVASNAPSHSPGEALTGEKVSERFVVDTTPPTVSAFQAELESSACPQASCAGQFHVSFDAVDPVSPISHAEYSLDAGPWQSIDPVGKLSDSLREHYDFFIPAPAHAAGIEHLIAVRVYDRYDNVVAAKRVIPAHPAAQ
ncbi:MAG: hypothetical protein ACP5FH_01185 [Terracidiphilus sp.]